MKIDANNGTTTGDTEGNQKLSYLFILVVVVVPICITTVGILVTLWKKSTKETPLLAESFLSDRPSQPSLELEVHKFHCLLAAIVIVTNINKYCMCLA